MKKILIIFLSLFFISNISYADFKKIKKKATVTQPEVIFPIPKKLGDRNEPHFNRTKSYGGQFHMDYPGLKDKVIFGMGGYGGNAILIDVENSRIVVLNSLHYNNEKFKYSHKKLLIDPIKKGK